MNATFSKFLFWCKARINVIATTIVRKKKKKKNQLQGIVKRSYKLGSHEGHLKNIFLHLHYIIYPLISKFMTSLFVLLYRIIHICFCNLKKHVLRCLIFSIRIHFNIISRCKIGLETSSRPFFENLISHGLILIVKIFQIFDLYIQEVNANIIWIKKQKKKSKKGVELGSEIFQHLEMKVFIQLIKPVYNPFKS